MGGNYQLIWNKNKFTKCTIKDFDICHKTVHNVQIMDKLKQWLKDNNISSDELAKSLKVSIEAVYKWMSGERKPDTENMNAIFLLTKGVVTPNDFILTGKVNNSQPLNSSPKKRRKK